MIFRKDFWTGIIIIIVFQSVFFLVGLYALTILEKDIATLSSDISYIEYDCVR